MFDDRDWRQLHFLFWMNFNTEMIIRVRCKMIKDEGYNCTTMFGQSRIILREFPNHFHSFLCLHRGGGGRVGHDARTDTWPFTGGGLSAQSGPAGGHLGHYTHRSTQAGWLPPARNHVVPSTFPGEAGEEAPVHQDRGEEEKKPWCRWMTSIRAHDKKEQSFLTKFQRPFPPKSWLHLEKQK